jgi:ubiquinone/menaquinone biosynthesis C-methylase UbiE
MADVQTMFGPTAANYATSVVHNNPTELARLVDLVQPNSSDSLLDVATGSGNVAFAFAPLVREVVALDITLPMLDQVRQGSVERGLLNIEARLGNALQIPAQGGEFDIVTLRLAAHHFSELPPFVAEVFRVLKPGGKFLLVDTAVPEDDELDILINQIEVLRDPSHVRSYRYSEWRGALEDEGFTILHEDHEMDWQIETGSGMDYDNWVARINTPQENRADLRQAFETASPALIDALSIEFVGEKISFKLPRTTLLALKPN